MSGRGAAIVPNGAAGRTPDLPSQPAIHDLAELVEALERLRQLARAGDQGAVVLHAVAPAAHVVEEVGIVVDLVPDHRGQQPECIAMIVAAALVSAGTRPGASRGDIEGAHHHDVRTRKQS